jgi:hypothetical protein
MLWNKSLYDSNIALNLPDKEDIILLYPDKMENVLRIVPEYMPYQLIRHTYGINMAKIRPKYG